MLEYDSGLYLLSAKFIKDYLNQNILKSCTSTGVPIPVC